MIVRAAGGELEPASLERARVATKLLHDCKGGVTCSPSVVLVGDGSPEQRHHAITGELIDRPLKSVLLRH